MSDDLRADIQRLSKQSEELREVACRNAREAAALTKHIKEIEQRVAAANAAEGQEDQPAAGLIRTGSTADRRGIRRTPSAPSCAIPCLWHVYCGSKPTGILTSGTVTFPFVPPLGSLRGGISFNFTEVCFLAGEGLGVFIDGKRSASQVCAGILGSDQRAP